MLCLTTSTSPKKLFHQGKWLCLVHGMLYTDFYWVNYSINREKPRLVLMQANLYLNQGNGKWEQWTLCNTETVHILKLTPLSKCGMPLWAIMGREFFEKTETGILLNFSESKILSQSVSEKNMVPKGEQADFSCAAQILHSASVTVLAKSATSPAQQRTCICAFQQLDSNAFRKDKDHVCTMKVSLIDYKLLPLALHKKSPETCSKTWEGRVGCLWRSCPR